MERVILVTELVRNPDCKFVNKNMIKSVLSEIYQGYIETFSLELKFKTHLLKIQNFFDYINTIF